MLVSGAFSKYSSGSPVREPYFQVTFTELPQRETLHLQSLFNHISKFLIDEPTPGCPTEPP